MIANHTSMAQLFGHTVSQFDKLFKRNAFLDQYRKEPMFQEGLEEFNSARCVLGLRCCWVAVECVLAGGRRAVCRNPQTACATVSYVGWGTRSVQHAVCVVGVRDISL
jgi:hypothetical protein